MKTISDIERPCTTKRDCHLIVDSSEEKKLLASQKTRN